MPDIHLSPIGVIHSPFREKFGIPRQAGLISAAKGHVALIGSWNQPDALRGIEDFSHLWLLWLARHHREGNWKTTVRPPRLGGNVRVGVFASRSIFRPNAIGQSLVRLEKVIAAPGDCRLEVSGLDVLDGTPLLDIKPFLPWADAPADARGGFAAQPPKRRLAIAYTPEAEAAASSLPAGERDLLEAAIACDPRPAYHDDRRPYRLRISDYEAEFMVENHVAKVIRVAPTQSPK